MYALQATPRLLCRLQRMCPTGCTNLLALALSRCYASGPLKYPRYVVNQLNNIALSSIASKDFAKAESVLRKSLTLCEMYTNPALLPKAMPVEEQGDSTQEPEEEISTQTWGANYLTCVLALLADNSHNQGKLDDTLMYLERLHAVNASLYSDEHGQLYPHLSVLGSLSKLAAFHYQRGNFEESEKLWNKVLELDEKYMKSITDKSRETTGKALYYIGRIRLSTGNFADAITILERSWTVYRNTKGIYHIDTGRVILELARAYHISGDNGRARTLVEFCGGLFERNALDTEAREEAKKLHIDVTTALSGEARSVRQAQPRAHRQGIDQYVKGESPEEMAEAQKQIARKKLSDSKWKKAFGLSTK